MVSWTTDAIIQAMAMTGVEWLEPDLDCQEKIPRSAIDPFLMIVGAVPFDVTC